MVDYAIFRNSFFTAFYTPYDTFSLLAQGLVDLQNGNGTIIYQLGSVPHIAQTVAAISCGDGIPINDDAQDLEEYNDQIANKSSFSNIATEIRSLCS